jgi:hypothetical protein
MVVRFANQAQRFRHAQIRRARRPLYLLYVDELAVLIVYKGRAIVRERSSLPSRLVRRAP